MVDEVLQHSPSSEKGFFAKSIFCCCLGSSTREDNVICRDFKILGEAQQ